MMTKHCEKCKEVFYKKSNCSKKDWMTRRFCSNSCANAANMIGRQNSLGATPWNKGKELGRSPRYSRVTKECLECSSEYVVKNYRAATAKFCSYACKVKAQDSGISTENEKQRKSVAYKKWRTRVFERDNYTCQECHEKGGYLHADHIKPFALFPELRTNVENGRTLCVDCHKKTDTYGFRAMYRNVIAVAVEA